ISQIRATIFLTFTGRAAALQREPQKAHLLPVSSLKGRSSGKERTRLPIPTHTRSYQAYTAKRLPLLCGSTHRGTIDVLDAHLRINVAIWDLLIIFNSQRGCGLRCFSQKIRKARPLPDKARNFAGGGIAR